MKTFQCFDLFQFGHRERSTTHERGSPQITQLLHKDEQVISTGSLGTGYTQLTAYIHTPHMSDIHSPLASLDYATQPPSL